MKKVLLAFSLALFAISVFAQAPERFVLLEEFSTAPCGFCPDAPIVADTVIANYPNVIPITHHAGFGTDSLTIPESIPIAGDFTNGAPRATIDRCDCPIPVYTTPPYIAISRQKWDSVCGARMAETAPLSVTITNSFNSSTRLLDVTLDVDFYSTPDSGDLRINLVLTEDSVVGFGPGYDQVNYYNSSSSHPLYQMGDPIIGYPHRHAVRAMPSGSWGTSGIIPSNPTAGNSFSHTYSGIVIPGSWDESKMDVVAFVGYYDADPHNRLILNSNHKYLLDSSVVIDVDPVVAGLSMEIYPNPSAGNTMIRVDNAAQDDLGLRVRDVFGRVVYSKEVLVDNRHQLEAGLLGTGLYFCELLREEEVLLVKKLVIQ